MVIVLTFLILVISAKQTKELKNDVKLAINDTAHLAVITDLIIVNEGEIITSSVDKTIKIWNVKEHNVG